MGNKYSNMKTACHGYSFASNLEASVFEILRLMERGKNVRDISVQPTVYLTDARIIYKPDFKCVEISTCLTVYVEAKGFETPEWRIKRKLWEWYGPGPLWIYKGSAARPSLHEVITPRQKPENIK